MTEKITKTLLEKLPTPERGRRLRVLDSILRGFGAVKHPSGRITFFARYGGRDHRDIALGTFGPLTVEQARDKARRTLGDVAYGKDPIAERQAERQAETFGEWADQYLAEWSARHKTAAATTRYLEWTRRRWGKRKLKEITATDVQRVFEERAAKHGKISANRWLATLKGCLQAAWRVNILQDNVARRVRPLPENPPRQRVLSDEELARVLAEIDKQPPFERAAYLLLITTGARRGEVFKARWADLDLEDNLWRLPTTKSGRPQVIPLASDTAAMLRLLPRVGPYVIPGGFDANKPRANLQRRWKQIREAAGCPDVVIHDLRRTYGLAVARTVGIHVASKLLRHHSVQITERIYAPLGIEDLRKATEKAARGRAKVIKLQRRGAK